MRGPRKLAKDWVARSRMKSPWLVHFDCGGCNGCDIEILDALTPRHSAERFGVINVGDPRQGDVLVVTGPANRRNAHVLRTVYDQMSEPKAVLAVGSCAAHGGIFRGAPNILGGVGDIVPVDAYVSGCPPTPEKILAGVIAAIPLLAERRPERTPGGAPAPGEMPDEPVLVTHPHAQLDDARWTAWSGPAGSAPQPLPVLAQSSPEEAPDGDAG